MKQKKEKLRIALICNNVVRELGTLNKLKQGIEQSLVADIKIIGSLAEIQRTYYSLYKFRPHVVFLSQLQEKCCRDIASYVKKAGGSVVVMPEEITPAKVVEALILNPDLQYDHLVDLVCLPGQVMYDFFSKTDISKRKIKITGSPKIDVELQQTGIKRKEFLRQYDLDRTKKNIFIFTSFPHTGMEYFHTDVCFSGNLKLIADIQEVIKGTQEAYFENLPRICAGLSHYNLILKPHPLEDMTVYKKIKIANLHVINGVSVNDCMDSIDIAIHWNSTVATSCWFHDVVSLQYSPIRKFDWLLSGFTRGNPLYSDSKELIQAVQKYSKNSRSLEKKYKDFQKDYFRVNFYKTDGKSTERIAQEVKKFVTKQNTVLDYQPMFTPVWRTISIVEKLIGVRYSRRLLTVLSNTYNWRYASDNYLP